MSEPLPRYPANGRPDPDEGTVLITGNTYPVRDALKELGGRWDPAAKGWRVPRLHKLRAEVLVGNAEQIEQIPGLEDE